MIYVGSLLPHYSACVLLPSWHRGPVLLSAESRLMLIYMYAGGDVYCFDYPFIAPVLIMLTVYYCVAVLCCRCDCMLLVALR